MQKNLKGIRVLDLGRYIAAPYCCQILGDLGADVIRVESAQGDETRKIGPHKDGVSMYVPTFGRSKRSVTVNFRSEGGREVLRRLIETADVLVSNFRPGVLEQMGLGYEEVKKIKPDIVMAVISGFGQTGSYCHKAAFNGIVTAMSGLMSATVTAGPNGIPMDPGVNVADHVTGIYTALGIVTALYNRARTGEGEYLDMAMLDCMVSIMDTKIADYGANGVNTGYREHEYDPLTCPFGKFQTKDGWVFLGVGSDKLYEAFSELTGDPVLQEERFRRLDGRIAAFDLIIRRTGEWFAGLTTKEAERLCEGRGIPIGPVNDIRRVVEENPMVQERGQILYLEVPGIGEVPFPGNPIKLKTSPLGPFRRAPGPGEHTDQVLGELGLREDELARLRGQGDI